MAAIIYEKTPGALTPTGQRTVSTFPSGLVRVDQTFVCRTSAATTHRIALAVGNNFPNGSDPAIDGLKIFPEVQEIKKDDGFTEFKVTAYGRTTASFVNYTKKAEKQRLWNYGITYTDGSDVSGQSHLVDAIHYKVYGKIVIPKGHDLSVEDLNLPNQIEGLKAVVLVNKLPTQSVSKLYNMDESVYEYVDWNGLQRSSRYITYKYFYGSNVNSNGEVDVINSVASRIVYDFPIIYVNNQTNYGSFTELEISVSGAVHDTIINPVDVL